MDYRKLNGELRLDQNPMPRIDELKDRLSKARFISILDFTKGYWSHSRRKLTSRQCL